MALSFYERMHQTATRLITQFGRSATLLRNSRQVVDPTKPWKGNDDTPGATLAIKCLVVPPNQVRIFGLSALGDATAFEDFLQISEKIVIYTPPLDEQEVKSYDTFVDEGVQWGIIASQILRPADITLIAYLGVRR